MNDSMKELDDLRKAVKSFSPAHELRLPRNLAEARALNISDGVQLAQALGRLRALFAKLDRWEMQHPSN